MQRVDDLLWATAGRSPQRTALVCGDERLVYGEFAARVERLAAALRARGVRRGDRVLTWLPNSVPLAVVLFAALAAGAAFVVVDPSSKPDRLAALCADATPRAVFVPAARAAACRAAVGPALLLTVGGDGGDASYDELLAVAAAPPRRDHIDRDLACLVYTSGSTGGQKGVMSAHHNVVFAARSILSYLGTAADDVVITALPWAFDYGLYQLLMAVACGATLVYEPFTFPAAFLERLAAERATVLPGVPTLWAMLLGMDLAAFDLSSLRCLTNTGAALSPAHLQRLRQALPQARLFAMYGLTETKRTLYLPPEWLDQKAGSVGIAIPGTEVWIEDERGQRLGDGAVGELVVRGGHVMLGYWNAPELSAQRFPPGPLPGERLCRTGDLFRRDADGCHWFVGRRDDLLKSRGQKVAPIEIEHTLRELPEVVDAAVIGVDDGTLGTAIVAHVVPRAATLDARAVLRHCKARLEDFKVPDRVVFHAALPRTQNGKVDRAALGRDSGRG